MTIGSCRMLLSFVAGCAILLMLPASSIAKPQVTTVLTVDIFIVAELDNYKIFGMMMQRHSFYRPKVNYFSLLLYNLRNVLSLKRKNYEI